MVTIPQSLIDKLKPLGAHFCLVETHGKSPAVGGKGWNLKENLMEADDSRLQDHLLKGGNFGVVGIGNLVILDCDNQEVRQLVKEKLPPTFTIESPGSHGWHCYFLCEMKDAIRLRDKNNKNIGDVQANGKMTCGPGSIHSNGGIYKIVRDFPLAQVTEKQIREALKEYVVPKKEIEKVKRASEIEKKDLLIDLDVLQVIPLSGLHRQGNEYYGPHPLSSHGSETGRNFWVNPSKNCWHCFRHGSGGGPLLWIALENGLISCPEAGPGILRGAIFVKALRKAVECGYLDSKEVDLNKYGTPIGDYLLKRVGKKAYLFDGKNEAITSCNVDSVDGPRFKKELRKITKLKENEVNQITANFTLTQQVAEASQKTIEENETEFSEETKTKAWELLRDPAFFYKLGWVFKQGFIISKLNKPRFIVGEEQNKRVLGFLLVGAAHHNMTSIIKFLGPPATAKDTTVRMWLDLLPIKYIERSYTTAAAVRYSSEMQESDLIYIPDSPSLRGEMGRTMRFMRADDGGLISEYALKDPQTGKMTTETIRLPVKGIVTTSNKITGDIALESGTWTLETDSNTDLTTRVKTEKLKLRAGNRPLFPDDELNVWKCMFKILLTENLLEELPEIPFAEKLIKIMESERSESRRDPDKLCDLIALITWIRRFQKPPEEQNEADIVDLYYALRIGLDAITQTISELNKKEQLIYQIMHKNNLLSDVTCRFVANETGFPYQTVYGYLEKLVDKGFILKEKSGGKKRLLNF